MQTDIQGQLERITFRSEENHFTIAKIKVKGHKNLVTVVGNLLPVSPGEILKLTGTWDRHPKYGEQFKFTSSETVVPATLHGIERYLGSGLIKGIGPVMAKRLVERFGMDTLEVIEKHTHRLTEVDGIGDKRIGMIRTAWQEQKEVRNVMLFLQSHDVSSAYAAKIYRQYGKDSVAVVKENPFRLATDIFGVGFRTADTIAAKLGMPKDSPLRAEAGILYVLQQLAGEGHVYYPHDELIDECLKILDIGAGTIAAAIKTLSEGKRIIIEDDSVYLAEFHLAEKGIAEHLVAISKAQRRLFTIDKDTALGSVQRDLKITLAHNQARAVVTSLDAKVLIITGGPGTGKTTIIRSILRLHRAADMRVLLSAPTGRAAKRMAEATGHEAKTIHRLLEFSPKNNGGFKRNEENPLEVDLLVIDETSMVDTVLMYHLLKAVPKEATLILVGDVDQLPSVGAGNVLRDIIGSGYVPCIRLNEIFRQSRESLIIVNAHRINSGELPVTQTEQEGHQDFYFIQQEEPEKVLETILNLCSKKVPDKFGFDPVSDIQVLTPMHRGVVGASNLNAELQKHLNSSTDELVRGGRVFRTGDKVMQVRNNYDKDIYNGDIGRVTSINREDQEISVDFDGRVVNYDFTELDELMLAYAVSVHKSQGSEYPVVIMPVLTQHYMLLQRNLLYTAVTRGKKLVILIGTKKALAIAIRNNKPRERYTKLKERLTPGNAHGISEMG
jgi:exodeoxyribonuclease V alpha subunit